MEILASEFGVKRVAVVGGGKINGAFLTAGLLDELSVMIAPGIDGRIRQPALFDFNYTDKDYVPVKVKIKEIKTFPNDVIWVRYIF